MKRNLHRFTISTALTLVVLSLSSTGCSSFNREWRRAGDHPPVQNSVEGRWEGTWLSDADHHHGKLLCLMTHETNSLYKARFKATYAGILKFGYTAYFEMEPHAALGWEFNGEAKLGAFGTYYYEGRATPTNLTSIYKSQYDNGTFNLRRP